MEAVKKPGKSRHPLSSETGSAGRSPSRPERGWFENKSLSSGFFCVFFKEHFTGRLLSCSRSPRICTSEGNIGLSVGSPCQQASMMPYLPAEGSTSQHRRLSRRPQGQQHHNA